MRLLWLRDPRQKSEIEIDIFGIFNYIEQFLEAICPRSIS